MAQSSDQELIQSLADRNLSVNGYFSYYGDLDNYKPFQWVYLSASGRIFAKLEGWDPQKRLLKWKLLMGGKKNYFKKVSFQNGYILVGDPAEVNETGESNNSASN